MYYLPTLILEQTLPADPLVIGDFDWGEISATSGDLPDALCAVILSGAICAPGTSATLALTQMRIVGLSNVVPSKPTVSGNRVTGTFQFGGVSNLPPGLTVPPDLAIQGTFAITLSCCASGDGKTCTGTPAQQAVTGAFTVRFAGAALAVTLDIDDALAVTARALSLTAGQVTFAFQTSSPGPRLGELNSLLSDAFNKGAGPTLLTIINERLGAAAVLTAAGGMLTPVVRSKADAGPLGVVVSILHDLVVNPSSSYYLPKEVKQANNPALDPFSADSWGIDDVGQWYGAAGGTICGSIGARNNVDEIQAPGTSVPLSLDDISIAGTSNVTVLPALVTGNESIRGMLAFNVSTDSPGLTISGTFNLRVTCCVTNDRASCAEKAGSYTGSGCFKATISNATVGVSVDVSISTDKKVVVTADSIYFRCDPNIVNPKNIQIDIDIKSIPAGDRDAWNNQAKKIFNSPQAASAMVTQIHEKLNQDAVLNRLSTIVTQALQSILGRDADLARRVLSELAVEGFA
jgi:hypothetical protein